MRKKFIAGNWKMYTNRDAATKLASAVLEGAKAVGGVDVAVCPPFPYLGLVADIVKGSSVRLGAQNIYPEKEGAFTGEVSPDMLVDMGCQLVILGHSERRHKMGEDDAFINKKTHAALAAGLQVILCLGETLAEREANQTEKVLDVQTTKGLEGITAETLGRIVIAYEPVWAIGTGKTASPQQAQDAHAFLRKRVSQLVGDAAAAKLIIQYGGSVNPGNAATLLSQPDVDGALVGGASLKQDQFLAIVQAGA